MNLAISTDMIIINDDKNNKPRDSQDVQHSGLLYWEL